MRKLLQLVNHVYRGYRTREWLHGLHMHTGPIYAQTLHSYVCMHACMYFCMYFILVALGLCCCAQAFSSCGEEGYSLVAVCWLIITVASLVVQHRLMLQQLQRTVSSCGSWA